VNSEQKARVIEIIKKDAWTTGLYEIADVGLAELAGCKVDGPIGCAVYSLAVAAGLPPWQPDASGRFSLQFHSYTPDLDHIKVCRACWRGTAYVLPEREFGLTRLQVCHIFAINDSHDNREERLAALLEFVGSFETE